MRFRITLALESPMREDEVEAWTLELIEDAAHHLLEGEHVELESVEAL